MTKTINELTPHEKVLLFDQAVKQKLITLSIIAAYRAEIEREKRQLAERLNYLTGPGNSGPSAPLTEFNVDAHLQEARRTTDAQAPAQQKRGRGRPPGSGKKQKAAAAVIEVKEPIHSRSRGPRAKPTSKQLASRRIQGTYLALLRQFPVKGQVKYSKMAKDRGREFAISRMSSALSK